MIEQDHLTQETPLFIEQEDGFQIAECEDLHEGNIYYTANSQGLRSDLKRAVSDPIPVYGSNNDVIEWHVEHTNEI